MRTEEKKRETARNREAQDSVPATPVVDVPPTPMMAPAVEAPATETAIEAEAEPAVVEETPLPADKEESAEAVQDAVISDIVKDEHDVPHATIEVSI